MMKKILTVLLLISVVATFFVLPAGAETSSRARNNAYDIMVDFVTENPARVSGSLGAEKSAEFIKNYFDNLVVGAHNPEIATVSNVALQKAYETEIQEFTYEVYTKGMGFMTYPTIEKIKDRNVVATKKSKNKDARTVIIGAHYDNTQGENQGSGAYDNGSGVGIMLSLAERFKDVELDFNLVFVGFGAHEYYYEGSAQFVHKMSLSEKLNVALYINLDSIAGGDNLYIYADEVKTIQEDYFLNFAKKSAIDLRPAPVNKGTYLHEYSKLGYAHVGLDSDNLPFFNEGILTVSFSAHNWTMLSTKVLDESADTKKPNIIGTKDDNIDTLLRLYGDKVKTRMANVENLIYRAITDSSFIPEMQRAKRENGDYSLILNKFLVPLITLGFLIIVTVFVVLLNKKYKGKKSGHSQNNGGEDKRGEEKPKVFADFD